MVNRTILECVVGSTLHGTSVDDGLEDLDIMAVVLESHEEVAGFSPKDTWVKRTKPDGVRSEAGDVDFVAYGLRKYLSLALKGNPTILLPLFAPIGRVRISTVEGDHLRALAPSIVSKRALAPFMGYMRQQMERLVGTRGQKNCTRPELVEAFGYDTKYAGHIARLGFQGTELMRTGAITLPMPVYQRNIVLDIRKGLCSYEETLAILAEIELMLKTVGNASPLPPEPDQKRVEQWMLRTYLEHWSSNAAFAEAKGL